MTRRLVVGGFLLAVLAGVFFVGATSRRRGVWSGNQDAIEAIRRQELTKTLAEHPDIARPMASYRVHAENAPGGIIHRGGGYTAQTRPEGLHFEAGGSFIDLRALRIEQGTARAECSSGTVSSPAFGDVRIDRGCLVEQYIFENTRTEQIFRIDQPLDAGALRVTIDVRTDLTGTVIQKRRTDGGWRDTTLQDGGLAFTDARGRMKIAYHGAMAVDAEGRRADLDPVYSNGRIVLEVPGSFMAAAAYPVAIDPWLELDFSASGGGISNSVGVAQTPSVVVVGGGNPWVAWSEQVGGNFEILFRYWNGFSWEDLAGSSTGNGISNNSGDSINPSLTKGDIGPYIAWQDDTSGTSQVYLKHWNGAGWEELSSTTPFDGSPTLTSATGSGVSTGIGTFSGYPSLSQMNVTIPTSGQVKVAPVLAYQSTNPGPTSIIVLAYWPGDPGQAADPTTGKPNRPVIPAGWYAFGGGNNAGLYIGRQMSATPAGFVSQKPSVAVGVGTQTPTVAWHDTRAGTHDIMLSQYALGANPGIGVPIFPTSRPPDFAYGTWGTLAGGGFDSFATGGITLNPPGTFPFSINPSLSLNGAGNPAVAWEHVLSLTDSCIFLRQWSGAAWVELGGSASGRGISNVPAPSIAATPSLSIDGTTLYTAWQQVNDPSGLGNPSNSEIYVRQFPGVVTGGWDEVGFLSNSATVGPSAGIGGVSQTTGGSLTPSISSNGGPSVAWQDYGSGTPQIFLRRFFQNQPLFLRQTTAGGATAIPFGAITNNPLIELRATAFSEDINRLIRLQVEVVLVGSPFVGHVTQESGEVTIMPNPASNHQGTAELVIQYTGLASNNYQWRARTVDDIGQTSAWVSAGASDGVTDFGVTAVSTVPPGPPTNLTVSLVGGVVQLNWTAPAGGADSYNVKRSTVAGGGGYPPATIISASGSVTTTTYADASAAAGNTYFYVVSSVRSGLESATNSNEVSITVPVGGGAGASPDTEHKSRCGLAGADALLALAAIALLRRRRR